MSSETDSERRVAGFPDRDTAEDAVRAAREAGADDIRVDDSADELALVREEMRDEAENARPGFFTPSTKRKVLQWTAIGIGVGVLVALAGAAVASPDVSVATLVLVAVVFGAAVGATVGFFYGVLVAGGLGGRRRGAGPPLEGERSVVVGAEAHHGDAGRLDRS